MTSYSGAKTAEEQNAKRRAAKHRQSYGKGKHKREEHDPQNEFKFKFVASFAPETITLLMGDSRDEDYVVTSSRIFYIMKNKGLVVQIRDKDPLLGGEFVHVRPDGFYKVEPVKGGDYRVTDEKIQTTIKAIAIHIGAGFGYLIAWDGKRGQVVIR